MNCKTIIAILIFLLSLLPASYSAAYQATFQPRITVSTEYTDNLERTNEDEQDDIITTVSPGFNLSIFGQTQGISLDYDPAYAWYQRNPDYDTLRHTGSMKVWKQATGDTRLYINDAFRYTEDPGAENLGVETQDRQGREPYYTNAATVGMTNRFGPADIFILEYNYRILENKDDTQQDTVEHNPTASLTYYPFRDFGTEAFFSFRRGEFSVDDEDALPSDDFENYYGSMRLIQRLSRSVDMFLGYSYTLMGYAEEEDADYKLHYPNIGTSYRAEDTTTFSVSAGYLVLDRKVETDDLKDEERLQVNADISKIWQFRTASLSVSGTSGYGESFFDQENLGLRIYYDAAAAFSHEFLRDISYEVNAGYRIDKYINIDPEREDRISTAGVGFVFSRIESMTARIDYVYRDLESDETEEEYTENRFSFTITLSPRNPIYVRR